jgi:hypothetical protein
MPKAAEDGRGKIKWEGGKAETKHSTFNIQHSKKAQRAETRIARIFTDSLTAKHAKYAKRDLNR